MTEDDLVCDGCIYWTCRCNLPEAQWIGEEMLCENNGCELKQLSEIPEDE